MWVSFMRLLSSCLRAWMASEAVRSGASGGASAGGVDGSVVSSSNDVSQSLARAGGHALPSSLVACDHTGSNW